MATAEKKYRPVIAIDFDGTIVDHRFPEIGKLKPYAKEVINEWYDKGYIIIVWTCRNFREPDYKNDARWQNAPLPAVERFLEREGVKFHTINVQQPGLGFYLTSPKIFANIYIDDRNLGGFPGWLFTKKAVEDYYSIDKNGDMKQWSNYHHMLNGEYNKNEE